MKIKLVGLPFVTMLVVNGAVWSSAQEDGIPIKKTSAPNAVQAAKDKARQTKQQARAKAKAEAEAKAVDINRATRDELMKGLSVSQQTANSIIAKRPYKTKADLVVQGAIPLGTYQTLCSRVAVK